METDECFGRTANTVSPPAEHVWGIWNERLRADPSLATGDTAFLIIHEYRVCYNCAKMETRRR